MTRGPEDSDATLVGRILDGDREAAESFIRRHYRAAYAIALATTGHVADAEDICHDALAHALARIDTCRDPDRVAHWLFRIVRNRSHNARAARRVRAAAPLDDVHVASPDDTAQDAERRSLRRRLESALSRLCPVQREVVLLHDLDGWDHRAIGAALGFSDGMSRQHLFTARRALRDDLRDVRLEGGQDR